MHCVSLHDYSLQQMTRFGRDWRKKQRDLSIKTSSDETMSFYIYFNSKNSLYIHATLTCNRC